MVISKPVSVQGICYFRDSLLFAVVNGMNRPQRTWTSWRSKFPLKMPMAMATGRSSIFVANVSSWSDTKYGVELFFLIRSSTPMAICSILGARNYSGRTWCEILVGEELCRSMPRSSSFFSKENNAIFQASQVTCRCLRIKSQPIGQNDLQVRNPCCGGIKFHAVNAYTAALRASPMSEGATLAY